MTRQTWSLASDLAANRRQFILSGASLAVLPWLGGMTFGQSRENPKFKSDPFTLGVASGDPAPDGMVLWTRLAPEPLAEDGGLPGETYHVQWEIASDDAMKDIVKKGTALATPQLSHSVHVEVSGLEPDRWYWYRFRCGDAQTVVGRTRTTPRRSAKPDQLRFAFASCQHFESGLYTAYEHMAKEDLDLILHLGDYIYEGAARENNVRKHNSAEIESLADYRARHALYRTDTNLQAAHALCPWLVVWDDHEFDNNCAADISEQANVAPRDFLLRRANAYQAYYENMPLRARSMPKGPDMKIFRRIPYGRLAQFDMLDTRQYRSDQPNNDKAGPLTDGVFDADATMLGDMQEKWLMAGMLRSTSNWNILGQQVMMGRANRGAEDQDRYSMDQWSGYDVPRSRLLKFIAERRIPNPVVLTGDIHSNWVNDLQVDFDNENDPVVATEFVGTSISSSGNGTEKPRGHESVMSRNAFVKFFNGERGYVSCTVTPQEWKSDYQVVEYVDKPGAPLVTRASFVVENNKPGAQQA